MITYVTRSKGRQVAAICLLILGLGFVSSAAGQIPIPATDSQLDKLQEPVLQLGASRSTSTSAHPCEITEKREITILCKYSPMLIPRESSRDPKIVLSIAFLSFEPHESRMRVELTFVNVGTMRISGARPVYLEIDDDSGHNHVRRVLPHVDLQKLTPGKPDAFSDRLLAPAFGPGNYIIKLWIPDPLQKFNSERNWLLKSKDVPDRTTGLNIVATFTVVH